MILILLNFRYLAHLAIKSEQSETGVKIKRLAEDRWIYLDAPPGQIWPRMQNYLSIKGIDVVRTDVSRGIIETADYLPEDDPNIRVRYRFVLEKSIHPDTSEIHLTQIQLPRSQSFSRRVSWPAASDDAERERKNCRPWLKVLLQIWQIKVLLCWGKMWVAKPRLIFLKRVMSQL